MQRSELALRDVYLARQRIAPIARRTPVVEAPASLARGDSRIVYKLENLQATGSFKVRGATNKILSLSDEEKRRGVMTVSSGNHGKAVSYVARSLGVEATVVVPDTVPENKRSSIREFGAELFIAAGMAHALEESRLVVEGGGAVGIAALMSGKIRQEGNVAVVLSGGNVDHATLLEVARVPRS